MKNSAKVGIGVGIAVAFLAVISYQVSVFDEKVLEEALQDPEIQLHLSNFNDAGYDLLDTCMKTENLQELQNCSREYIPKILEDCKDKVVSTAKICSDPQLVEFSVTIDERIESAKQSASEQEQEIESLETKLQEMQENELPNLFYQSQYDGEVITDYKQLLRACIRHAEDWNLQYAGVENNDIEFEISRSYLREDLNFCDSAISEIEDKCAFHELCSGIEEFYQIRNQLITTEKSPTCSGSALCISGTVTRVIDGDTVEVDCQSIRFALSSAPEMDTDKGVLAKSFVENLCPTGSQALVDEDDKQTEGSYGRIIGVVYCNGINLNEAILESDHGLLSTNFCSKSEFARENWAKKFGC